MGKKINRWIAILMTFIMSVYSMYKIPVYVKASEEQKDDRKEIVALEEDTCIVIDDEECDSEDISCSECDDGENNSFNNTVTVKENDKEVYDLWVGNVRVSEDNKENIPGIKGSASYNALTNTLTLYDVKGINSKYNDAEKGQIYIYSEDDLIIEGKAELNGADTCIYVKNGTLTLDADLVLHSNNPAIIAENIDFIGGNVVVEADAEKGAGIEYVTHMTMSSGSLVTTGKKFGIYTLHGIMEMYDGYLNATGTADNSYGVFHQSWTIGTDNASLRIYGGGFYANGKTAAAIAAGKIIFGEGIKVLEPVGDYLMDTTIGHPVSQHIETAKNLIVGSYYYKASYIFNGEERIDYVKENTKAEKPDDPVRERYDFKGWYTEPECINLYDFSKPVTADFSLYAGWETKWDESILGPKTPDLSQYTASSNEIAAKSINLKKTLFADTQGSKTFEVTEGDTAAVKIKGSTLTIIKDGTVTIAALNNSKEKLAEKTITVIAPIVNTTQPTVIARKGNIDLNKYVSSVVKPSGWKSSNNKVAEVSSEGLLMLKKSGTVKITVTFPAEIGMKAKKLTIKLKITMPQFKKTTYKVKMGKTISTAVKNANATEIAYMTENPKVATVDSQGRITGVNKGTTKLIMTVKNIDYETIIKVK